MYSFGLVLFIKDRKTATPSSVRQEIGTSTTLNEANSSWRSASPSARLQLVGLPGTRVGTSEVISVGTAVGSVESDGGDEEIAVGSSVGVSDGAVEPVGGNVLTVVGKTEGAIDGKSVVVGSSEGAGDTPVVGTRVVPGIKMDRAWAMLGTPFASMANRK